MRVKDRILIFGGTTEGRILAGKLTEAGIEHTVSVATGYGRHIEEECGEGSIIEGRQNSSQIGEMINSSGYTVVVDATHPFAIRASAEIKSACDASNARYIRLSRNTSVISNADTDFVTYADSAGEAGDILDGTCGNIMILTGSRDLNEILGRISDKSRVYVRVLPSAESISKCCEAGLLGRQIIAMQGPFSEQLNESLFRECNVGVILTKESGREGGFYEKIEAAKKLGIRAVVIRNPEAAESGKSGRAKENSESAKRQGATDSLKTPEENESAERCEKIKYRDDKYDLEGTLKLIEEITGVPIEKEGGEGPERKVFLAGVGPGDVRLLTCEVRDAFFVCDTVFGAASVLSRIKKSAPYLTEGAVLVPMYDSGMILDYLSEHKEVKRALVAYSGDISLCSGARDANEVFEREGYVVEKLSGISSLSLFASLTGIPLEEGRVVSAHGRKCNVTGYVRQNENLFVLPSDANGAATICENILSAERDSAELTITAGTELGSDAQEVFDIGGSEDILKLRKTEGRVILFIHNPSAVKKPVIRAISDEDIIRGEVPMTKEEIRGLVIRYLGLCPGAVLFDIGAGTGSVSVEAALLHPEIQVFSVEKNSDAIGLLQSNREKYSLENMNIVEGEAPDILSSLPKPSHVFIGGSGKRLPEIITAVTRMNSDVKIVMTCVTPETMTQALMILKEQTDRDAKVVQVSATRYIKRGNYHMPDAMNPVYIIGNAD